MHATAVLWSPRLLRPWHALLQAPILLHCTATIWYPLAANAAQRSILLARCHLSLDL